MLVELDISSFAIVEALRLRFAPGFNVLTGETGAGKSIIIDAIGLLVGGRASTAMIRAGGDRARVEGIFQVTGPDFQDVAESFGARPEDAGLILSREVGASGRSICRINGRAVPLSVLQDVGRRVVDIHGQGDHLSLTRVHEHMELLDRYAGLLDLRGMLASKVRAVRGVRRELAGLTRDERERARRIDLLTHQVGEIEAARLVEGEEEALRADQILQANAERIMHLAGAAHGALTDDPSEQGASAIEQLAEATQALAQLTRLDPSVAELHRVAESLGFQLEDLAQSLRKYRDGIERDPERLDEIEERLGLILGLKRKYGSTIREILDFGRSAGQELVASLRGSARIGELGEEERRLLLEIGELAAELSAGRIEAAGRLTADVERELGELGLEAARFGVRITWRPSADGIRPAGRVLPLPGLLLGADGAIPLEGGPGAETSQSVSFGEGGVDRIEFLIAPNPGEPLGPLGKIASGGETSRLMLALRTALSRADPVPVLVFDEIDAGIGGRVGEVVGAKLWRLARRHQVMAVTHLPQIACYGDLHVRVDKQVIEGRAAARAIPLEDAERPIELSQMLGSQTEATRRKAEELLEETQSKVVRLARSAVAGADAPRSSPP